MLKLERPIVWFDIESTGVNREEDRIVELCMIKQNPDGSKQIKTRRFNPGMPIPNSASEVHGIYDDDVKDESPFGKLAKGIHAFIKDCDLGGFNSNAYDIPMLYSEFLRCGIEWDYSQHRFVDVGNIFKRHHPRTLGAAVQLYCGHELDGAHNAENDVVATMNVFNKQLETHEDLPKTIDELHLYSNYDKPFLDLSGKFTLADDNETILLNFGKYKGEPANEHLDFLEWMVYKASFSPDTNKIALEILNQ